MKPARHVLRPEALTADAFAPFGEVVATGGTSELINQGSAQQFADLAKIDVAAEGGRPRISIYRARPCDLPFAIRMLERHPLSSQCFVPMSGQPFLVVVAPPGRDPEPAAIRAFVTDGRQGINYGRGTWHHPLLAFGAPGDFLVIDRAGAGANCDEYSFGDRAVELAAPG